VMFSRVFSHPRVNLPRSGNSSQRRIQDHGRCH
jgi:hypothetical protein